MRPHFIWIMILLFLTLIPPNLAISCGSTLKGSNTVLTFNILCPQNGFLLEGAATLDCQGHTITGSGIGVGIHLTSNNNHISNCKISGFDTGIVLNTTHNTVLESITLSHNTLGLYAMEDSQTSIHNVLISNHAIGLYLQGSSLQPLSFILNQNNQDSLIFSYYPTQRAQPYLELTSTSPPHVSSLHPSSRTLSSLDTIPIEILEPPADLLVHAKVPLWMSKAGQQSVNALKQVTFFPDKTRVTVSILALHDIYGLSIIEYIPKDIALDSSTITSSDPPFIIRQEDLVIEFPLGNVQGGEYRNVTYTIDHRLAPHLVYSPFTIISVVERITPELASITSILSILFASILAFYQYLRYKTQQPPLLGFYVTGYILSLTIITGLGWIQTKLILSPTPTATTLIGLLLLGIIILTFQCSSLLKNIHNTPKE